MISNMKNKKVIPTILQLNKEKEKFNCSHLIGREVIDKCINDLATAKLTNGYCQNWERCSENGWPQCSPDINNWVTKLKELEFVNIFSKEELEVISNLKIRSQMNE